MKLILIHGSGNTKEVWYYQTAYFLDCEAINLPGHLQEGEPATSVDGYAEWVHEYLLKRGYKEPVLAGHSLGGAIAQTYALKYPDNLKALILIATGARLRVHPDFLALMQVGIAEPSKWLKEFVEPMYARVSPELREVVVKKVAKVGAAVQLNDFQCCDKFDIMGRVHEIRCPALIICGSDDNLTPVKYSQYLANKLVSSHLIVIEGGTHFVFMEKPDAVNQAIEKFLRSL